MTADTERPPLRIAGIIGYPLAHSVSPAMHQAAFDALGLRMRYERWETPPDHLEWRVAFLRNQEVLGANVTVPHKERVIPLLDELDDLARLTGAVNTIVNRRRRLTGYNTDAPGFLRALREDGAFDPKDQRALVLGAGGAARAVAVALLQAGVGALWVSNRTPQRAESLVSSLGQDSATLIVTPWGSVPPDVTLIVNTTTLGMRHGPGEGQSPLGPEQIPAGALVCDLVYNPEQTPLLVAARRAGARCLGGLPMLVYQGAIAFELWTGRTPPADVMLRAAHAALPA
jgi:shikimate dehydrogenase